MVSLQNISYAHPNKEVLFSHIDLIINNSDKIAVIGNNGVGKSSLLKIIAGYLPVLSGIVSVEATPYYVPQAYGQYNHLTIAQALGIEHTLNALNAILAGDASASNFEVLGDDWNIEERCSEVLNSWGLPNFQMHQRLSSLSGGQKAKIFLAGVTLNQPELLLLDEPGNHLDKAGRSMLYDLISSYSKSLVVVSHDRSLLDLLPKIGELSASGIKIYGGNYRFYVEQKDIEQQSLDQAIHTNEKALRKAKEKEREANQRQQKLDARGKGKQTQAGVSRIMMNTLRNKAEKSTSKTQQVHAEKTRDLSHELHALRASRPDLDKIKFDFNAAVMHQGKMLFRASGINFSYTSGNLWNQDLSLEIYSGERIALSGDNGSGKTTLLKIIRGSLQPSSGEVFIAPARTVYIDQEYSLINDDLNVYQQAELFNTGTLPEHEIKIRLARFLFDADDWAKPCNVLSGGERMRLLLCCMVIDIHAPDLIILDEPTNNIDIKNIQILSRVINDYRGTLIVVSHDELFLEEVDVQRFITMPSAATVK